MKIHVMENASQIGKAVGSLFVDAINEKPDITLGLATGASPIPAYKYIYKAYEKGKVSLKEVKTFNLDEYVRLPKNDPNSYYSFFAEHSIVRELGGDSYLSGWTKDEIQYEINYLLATHGYIFKNDKWKNYFYQYNWYHPVSSDMAAIVGTFNSTELENYEYLGRYRDAHFK